MKIAVVTQFFKEPIVEADRQAVSVAEVGNVPNSSCTSIYLSDSLDYLPVEQRGNAMMIIASKLRYGGELILRGIDLTEVSRQIFTKSVNIESAQYMLYNNRQSADCMAHVVDQLKGVGLEISLSYIDNMFYQIEARRPNAS